MFIIILFPYYTCKFFDAYIYFIYAYKSSHRTHLYRFMELLSQVRVQLMRVQKSLFEYNNDLNTVVHILIY